MSKTILFYGDSITDAQRNRDDDNYRGSGYATIVSARLGLENPGKYSFVNRGILGNTVVDLYKRRQADVFGLKPDIMSILIGVNDAAVHNSTPENPDGVYVDEFERVYTKLIEEILSSCPGIKLIMLEPFVLPGSLSCKGRTDIYPGFRHETELRAQTAQCVAEKFGIPFIRLQRLFDEACKNAPCEYWLHDGVHPTAAGHEIIAREWLKSFDLL